MKPDILVTDALLPKQMAALEAAYQLHRYDLVAEADKQAFLNDAAQVCTGMVTIGHFDLTEAFIAGLPNIKIVACASVGYDCIDVDSLTSRNIRFTNTPDVLTDDVADVAIMLMLAMRRRLRFGDQHVRTGNWGRIGAMPLTKRTSGSKVGIVGLGRIGKAIAKRCESMQQEVAYFGRREQAEVGYRYFNDLEAMAEWADIVISAIPASPETQGIVSEKVIQALGSEGTFVNIARGSVVDEPALIAALKSGALGAAGLDVYYNEPNPSVEFSEMDNVILYPHHGSGTVETRDAMAQLVVDNLAAFYADKPLLTAVN